MKPEKKVLIVTGGSRGIGASIATKAAKMGYSVCVNYRKNSEQANQIVEEINSKGGEAIAVQADISSIKEVENLFRTAEIELGTLSTLALSKEVALEGIRVNAVSPGIIETDQHDFSDELVFKNIKKEIPIGRLGTPQEVACAVLWLLSDKAAYVTGTVLPVAGGR
jgi:NAD(P)-dependent dehydrogenase (short-subunit alcohol dehydrogenase family)